MEAKEVLLNRLDETVTHLIEVCRTVPDPDAAVYEDWTAKDMLGNVIRANKCLSFKQNAALPS